MYFFKIQVLQRKSKSEILILLFLFKNFLEFIL